MLNVTGFESSVYGIGFVGAALGKTENAVSLECQDGQIERCSFMSFNSSDIVATKLMNKWILDSWVEYQTGASPMAAIEINNTQFVWISGNIFAGNLQDDIRTDGTVTNIKLWDNKVGHGNSETGHNCTFFNANSGTLTALSATGDQLLNKENFFSFNTPSAEITLTGEQYDPDYRYGSFITTTSTITNGQIIGGSVSELNSSHLFNMTSGGYFSIQNVAGYNPIGSIAGAQGTAFIDSVTSVSNNMGYTSIGSANSYETQNQMWSTEFTAASDANTFTNIFAYTCGYSTTVSAKVAIFASTNNGSCDVPTGSPLASSSTAVSVTTTKGWYQFPISYTPTGGTNIGYCIIASGGNFTTASGATNQTERCTITYPTFPTSPIMTQIDNVQISIHASYMSSFTLENDTSSTCYQSPKTLYLAFHRINHNTRWTK